MIRIKHYFDGSVFYKKDGSEILSKTLVLPLMYV